MFRFAHPDFLYLLFLLPVLVAFYVYAIVLKKKAIKKYGNPELLAELMPEVSPKRQHLKFWLLFGAITMVIIVMAGPQFGSKLETVKRQGVEIMVCLDVSNSMLAEDVSPDRLSKAKQMLSKLTDGFSNDKVGLIVFAGDAFTQLPITSDYVSAKMFLSSINPSMVSTQGTAIGAAINLAVRSFTPSETSDKAIILITDGENHEDDAVKAAAAAAEKGIHVGLRRPFEEEIRRRGADPDAQRPVFQHAQDGRTAPAGDRQGAQSHGNGRREPDRTPHTRRYGRRTPVVHGAALPQPLHGRHELPRQIRILLAHHDAQDRAGDPEPGAVVGGIT